MILKNKIQILDQIIINKSSNINLNQFQGKNNKNTMKWYQIIFITISSLIWNSLSYLQFQLVRIPHHTKFYNYGIVQCLNDIPKNKYKNDSQIEEKTRLLTKKQNKQQIEKQDDEDDDDDDDNKQKREKQISKIQNQQIYDQDNFKEICYEKDISYAIQVYNQRKQLMYLSMDMTTPISWIKGDKCYITDTHRKCNRVQINYKDQMKSISKKFKSILKNPFHKHNKKTSKKQIKNSYALIQGSSQIVKGTLQKAKNIQFMTYDSGRLTRFFDMILIGFGLKDLNSNLKFQNTTFISAIQITPALNYLCDGAISLRFDQNSQSSFIKQMSSVAQTSESYVSIFLGKTNQTITIGQLTVKNSIQGLSSLNWITVQQDELNGKLPRCQKIQLTETNSQSYKQIIIKLPVILTLSSSSISIPQQYLLKIIQKFFKKSSCQIQQDSRFIICQKLTKKQIQQKQINFVINQTTIMIPFKYLIIQSKSHHVKINIKSSLDKRYIILGQPIFLKYFVVLDYQNNRIGLSLQRQKFSPPIFGIVFLVRLIIWMFMLGCLIICFAIPIHKCYTSFKNIIMQNRNKSKKKKGQGTKEQTSKFNVYQSIQQDPYQDIKGKIQEICSQPAEGI